MCGPLPIVLAAASAAVSASGQLLSGVGAANQYKYEASIAQQNSKIADSQAQDSILNTNLEAQRRYRELAQTKGQQQAAMAANGVSLDFGSAIDIQKDTAATGAEDIAQIYKGGAEKTKSYDISSWNYRSQAAADQAKASSAITGAIFGAASTALGGASQISKLSPPKSPSKGP